MAEREMVKVHVDDGTTRGYDLKFTREDAEKYIANRPGASLIEDAVPEAKAEEPAENKAMSASKRGKKTDGAEPEVESK